MLITTSPKATLFGAVMTIAAALVPHGAEAVTIKEITSPGGIKAWLVEDYTVPIVTMNIAFRGGAAQEDDDRAGLANLMSGLLDEGAGKLDSKTFQTRLQDLNVNLSFDAGKDAFYGNLRTLSTNQDAAFELFRIALNEPRFDEEPVERIRGQVLSGLKRSETDPREIAGKAWAAALFGRHPYGRPTDGTVKTVEGISVDNLKAFHKRIIARDNLHIAVVGAIDAARLEAVLDRVFAGLPEKAQLNTITEILPRDGASDHVVLSVPQTFIRVGGRGLKRNDPDFIAAYVANHILGGGSFSSRLYAEIREKRGLAYSVGTGLAAYDHAGAYIGATATRADQAQTAIDIMTGQIKDFSETGPTEAELDKAKSYLIGNYALRFDASQKIARQLIGIQLDELGIDYIDKRNDLIRSVTKDDVTRAAKRVFGGPVSIITVGPSES